MAFEQNVTLGPGSATLLSHTFEILVMLGGALAFGYLISHLLSQVKLRQREQECELEQKHRHRVEGDFDHVRAEHSALGSRVHTLEGELNSLRSQHADCCRERDEARLGLELSAVEAAAHKRNFTNAEREGSELKTSVERLGKQLGECSSKQGELRTEVERLRSLLEEMAHKRAQLEAELSELQDEDRTNKHDINLVRVRTELSAALANRDAQLAENERLRAQLQAGSPGKS